MTACDRSAETEDGLAGVDYVSVTVACFTVEGVRRAEVCSDDANVKPK
jgi:hypothetical protein